MRSWAIRTDAGDGATRTRSARWSSAAAGGFSNSVVTTSQSSGEPLQRRGVVVRRHQVHVGHRSRRRGRVGVEHERAVAHRAGGDEGVPAELTAAQHAERRRRDDRLVPHRPQRPVPFTRRRAAAAPSPPRRRGVGAGSRAARSARESSVAASIATANSAAFVAPASPMANVATGTPAGICTIECSESWPGEVPGRHGHPEHRHGRLGRQHPRQVGRTAGTGDDRPQAAPRCLLGVLEHLVGHPVGAHDPRFVRHAELGQHVDRLRHRRPVARRSHHHADHHNTGDGRFGAAHARTVRVDPQACLDGKCAWICPLSGTIRAHFGCLVDLTVQMSSRRSLSFKPRNPGIVGNQ